MFERDSSNLSDHEQPPSTVTNDPMILQSNNNVSQVRFAFTKDNVPIVDPCLLPGVAIFEQLYLILGETIPLKLLTSKCLTELKPIGEIDMVDIGNGFYLFKFSNVLDQNAVIHGYHWFVGG